MSDPDPTACPQCGAEAVKRQLTAPSFRLSGSGWYETDFKKDGKRNLTEKTEGAGSTAPVTPAAAAKSEPKAESKPAAKPEPAPKPAASTS